MTKHHRPREFEQPAPPPCPVAELAKRYGAAVKEHNLVDHHQPKDDGSLRIEDAMVFAEGKMEALQEAAVFEQPTSPLGALFLLLLTFGEVAAFGDFTFEHNKALARKHEMRLETALWGVRRFLETHFGISSDDIGGEYMMVERCSFASKLADAVTAAKSAEPEGGAHLRIAS